jgi:hypothetical protein
MADSAAAIATSRLPASSRIRDSTVSLESARSRSSLISRLVVRMLRASPGVPPSTRRGPRKTSPSGVAAVPPVSSA